MGWVIAWIIFMIIFDIIFLPIGWWLNKKTGLILALCLSFFTSGCLTITEYRDYVEWNNGICTECGGNYKFKNATKTRNNMTVEYYACENCDHVIQQ